MQWRSLALLPLLCLLAALGVNIARAAEQWDCRFLLSDRGVQFPEVREFVEDLQGRIWASSWGGGVACIDGTVWKTYTEADGLASDWVRGLTLGEDGTVWISTPAGLCYFREERLHCLHPSAIPPLSGDEPDLIFMTTDGDLVVSTYEGALLRVRGASNRAALVWEEPKSWEVLLSRYDPDAVRIADFEEDGAGRLVVAFKDDSWAVLADDRLERQAGPGGTMYLARDPGSSTVWGASSLTDVSGDVYTLMGPDSGVRHALPWEVRGLVAGRDGWCYAATTAGLYRFNGTALAQVDLGHQVGFPDINEAFIASDGSLWLGTREGLVRGAPHAWKHYPTTAEGHGLVALLRDPMSPAELLAIDDRSCLARLNNDVWTESIHLAAPEHLSDFHTFDNQPYVWAMGSVTLYKFDLADGSIAAQFPMPETGLDRLLFMTSGGELWLAAEEGAFALADGSWEPLPRKAGYDRRTVNAFCETTLGVFYIGLSDGIERWAGDEITYFGEEAGIAEEDGIYSIRNTRSGEIWFGSYGSGVYAFDGETFERYDDRRGLAHHSVSNILEDIEGTLWLTYRRVGIASYRDERWLNFGFVNGLTNSAIKHLVEEDGGGLWLITDKEGFYRYRPDTESPDTWITAGTEDVPHNGIGVFSFRAADAWQRTAPHVLLYSWRVVDESANTEIVPWNNFSSETSYIADDLPPGDYRFEVRASDDARNVDPDPAMVSFVVAEPVWQEFRFLAPVSLMVLLLAVTITMRMRAHRALRRSEAALSQSNQQLMSEIRERIQAEQRLSDHFEQLEELIRGRTAALETAQRALVEQERLATLGQVTASVSHELRNPLGTLRSTLFTIGRKVEGLDLGLEDALARGERSIQRCDRIIEEFLDFTRKVPMEREPVDMDRWLGDLLEEMQLPGAIQRSFSLASGVTLEVDPERLRRAVVNVVNNAVQALVEHGGDAMRLGVSSRVRGGRFEIEVSDNGPGMSPENLTRIFEPLFSTKGFGVGLGVPIVKGIMVRHDGGVEYSSTPGSGTTVVLWIPC